MDQLYIYMKCVSQKDDNNTRVQVLRIQGNESLDELLRLENDSEEIDRSDIGEIDFTEKDNYGTGYQMCEGAFCEFLTKSKILAGYPAIHYNKPTQLPDLECNGGVVIQRKPTHEGIKKKILDMYMR